MIKSITRILIAAICAGYYLYFGFMLFGTYFVSAQVRLNLIEGFFAYLGLAALVTILEEKWRCYENI